MMLSMIASALSEDLIGEDIEISGFCIDSRKAKPGDLFVAINTDNANGHDYIAAAQEKGAVAALVSECVDSDLPRIMVADTVKAFGEWAGTWSAGFIAPIIAITGSCGKTTVKEMTTAVMSTGNEKPVLATKGNLNNHLGVPLTLLRLTPNYSAAVVEMGANHQGEIKYLTEMTQPDIAILNNAAGVHLEGFGSLEGVAKGKGEIFSGLSAKGFAVINADDTFAGYWKELAAHTQIKTFAIHHSADVMAKDIKADEIGTVFTLICGDEAIEINLHLSGEHNVMNALAAATAAIAAGKTLTQIKLGLEGMQPVAGRLEQKAGQNGALVIDDSYNANPYAFRAAVDVLSAMQGKRICVMGDMAELGDSAEQEHFDCGTYAAEKNIDHLAAVGPLCESMIAGYKSISDAAEKAKHFSDKASLVDWLKPMLSSETKILIKGSRSMQMEEVVNALVSVKTSDELDKTGVSA